MPAAVIPFRSGSATSTVATWSLLEIARPGLEPEPLGVLLVDDETGRLSLRIRNADEFQDLEEQDADFLAALPSDFESKALEPGAGHALLDFLENCLSGFLRIGGRTAIEYSGNAAQTVDRLFDQYVDGYVDGYVDKEVRPFVTHLPLYGLRAAASRFGDEFDQAEVNEPDAWVRAPKGVRLTESMFVAQVVGRSMEPLIPDGSFCLFRGPVVGSRQGKRLLIEQTGGAGGDPGSRYTVKRYTSIKKTNDDGTWQHDRIRLEPLNPEFEAFDLGEGDFRVIAEFVQVLPS